MPKPACPKCQSKNINLTPTNGECLKCGHTWKRRTRRAKPTAKGPSVTDHTVNQSFQTYGADAPESPSDKPQAPRLGTHEAAKHLITILAELYPDAKRTDWSRVRATLETAKLHNGHWCALIDARKG